MARISKWESAVREYERELFEGWTERGLSPVGMDARAIETVLLNGADDWRQYSEGACSLYATEDLIERLCTPSEAKRAWRDGSQIPYKLLTESQPRALRQAARRVVRRVLQAV